MARSSVQSEIRQSRPFRSKKQEATIALLRTASVVGRALGRARAPGRRVPERRVEEGTTITRILDKLEQSGYIRRERALPDRRQVMCEVTAEGRRLLDKIDPLVDAGDEEAVASLVARDVAKLIDLLDTVRAAN